MRRSVPLASGIAALACVVLAFAPGVVTDWLAFDRQAIGSGQLWRLWTAHVVHFSGQHALADAAVLLLAGALAEREIGARRLGMGLALGAPFISLGLFLGTPDLLHYRGASGIAVMAAFLAGASLWRTSPAHRALLALLSLGFVMKTACEAFGVSADLAGLPQHVAVAWQAHVLGAIWGGLTAFTGSPTAIHPCRR